MNKNKNKKYYTWLVNKFILSKTVDLITIEKIYCSSSPHSWIDIAEGKICPNCRNTAIDPIPLSEIL